MTNEVEMKLSHQRFNSTKPFAREGKIKWEKHGVPRKMMAIHEHGCVDPNRCVSVFATAAAKRSRSREHTKIPEQARRREPVPSAVESPR